MNIDQIKSFKDFSYIKISESISDTESGLDTVKPEKCCDDIKAKLEKRLEIIGKATVICKSRKNGKIFCTLEVITDKNGLGILNSIFKAIGSCCGSDCVVKSSSFKGKKFIAELSC